MASKRRFASLLQHESPKPRSYSSKSSKMGYVYKNIQCMFVFIFGFRLMWKTQKKSFILMYWLLCFSSATPCSRCRQGVVLKASCFALIQKLIWYSAALHCAADQTKKCSSVIPRRPSNWQTDVARCGTPLLNSSKTKCGTVLPKLDALR